MGSAIIPEVPIVDCRASAEVSLLHITRRKPDTGFSYIFNAPVQRRPEQRAVRCNRLLGGSLMLAGLLPVAARQPPIDRA